MAVTVEELRAYTGAASADDDFLAQCLATSADLVTRYVGTVEVPDSVLDRSVLEAASELFHRRQAPNGISQFATVDGTSAMRVARDPMVAAYPILSPFMAGGIA